MDETEQRARRCAKKYACQIAAYAFATRLMPMPSTAKEWRDRRDRFVDENWPLFAFWAEGEI